MEGLTFQYLNSVMDKLDESRSSDGKYTLIADPHKVDQLECYAKYWDLLDAGWSRKRAMKWRRRKLAQIEAKTYPSLGYELYPFADITETFHQPPPPTQTPPASGACG